MKYYFKLQYQILTRRLKSLGIPPWWCFILAIPSFIILSEFLFYKTDLAPYIYLIISFFTLGSLIQESRLSFLKSIFTYSDYYQIRALEATCVGIPFLIFLLLKGEYWCAGGVFLASIFVSLHKGTSMFIKTLPTPFGKYPFEFIIGFRQYILLIALTYFTLLMGVKVGNYELSLFSIAAQAFISVFFYNWVEPKDYITIHSMTSFVFLRHKLEIALRQKALLFIVPLILVLIFFPSQWWISLLLAGICYLYLATVIASKYAFYPSEFNLLAAILLGFSLFFPPLLIILLPYYLAKARNNLNSFLS